MPNIRREMPDVSLTKDEFKRRFHQRFYDPAFAPLQEEIELLADAAWEAYDDYRKAPRTERAGPGFADPDYEIIDRMARGQPKNTARRAATETPFVTPAHFVDEWRDAQRAHLPR